MRLKLLSKLLLFTSISIVLNCHAEGFLVCSEPQIAKESGLQNGFSLESINQIIYTLAGDNPTAYLGFAPKIVLTNAALPEAFVDTDQSIHLSIKLLNMLHSKDELAYVVAHELSHLVLKHANANTLLQRRDSIFYESIKEEIQADLLAIKLIKAVGFNPDSAQAVLNRLADTLVADQIDLATLFPTLRPRLWAMEMILHSHPAK